MTHVHLPFTPQWLWWPQPWVWLLVLLAALPLAWMLWLNPRRRPTLRYSDLSDLRSAGASRHGRWRLVLPILRTVALAALLLAAARPREPNESRRTQVQGIAIQMVLDISSSMLDTDLAPAGGSQTRLDVVRDVFRRFVMGDGRLPGRANDLIGMIRFAAFADSICPLTLDREVLLQVLDDTRTVLWLDDFGRWRGNRQEDGTAIGDGLALAVERLKDLKRTTGSGNQLQITSRIVILLSDGENNAGMITPEQAGELAATYGIRVYTILAGTGRRMPWGQRLPLDDSDLRRIAEVTGGKYFHATDAGSLEKIYTEIDRLERTQIEEHSYVEWGELSWPLLVTAFACLGLTVLLEATWLRKIP